MHNNIRSTAREPCPKVTGSRKEGLNRSAGEGQESFMDGEAADASLEESVETIRWSRRG